MTPYDFSPLYRSFVGFDRMANLIDAASQSANQTTGYPPYNVAQLSEDTYRIELAVAGFTPDDIEMVSHENVLTITGAQSQKAENDAVAYLHRGIAERGFERRFQLADHVKVASADLNNGLLTVTLVRDVPEALKPRKIAIGSPSAESDEKLIDRTTSGKKKAA